MIVFDLETTGLLSDPNTHITIGVAWYDGDNKRHRYSQERMTNLALAIKKDGVVGGQNINAFDMPFLERETKVDLGGVVVFDTCLTARRVRNGKNDLNSLMDMYPWKDGLITHKTANGKEAIKMWEEGRIEELYSYCEQDVALETDLCFAMRAMGIKAHDGSWHKMIDTDLIIYKSTLTKPQAVSKDAPKKPFVGPSYEETYKATYGQYKSAWD